MVLRLEYITKTRDGSSIHFNMDAWFVRGIVPYQLSYQIAVLGQLRAEVIT